MKTCKVIHSYCSEPPHLQLFITRVTTNKGGNLQKTGPVCSWWLLVHFIFGPEFGTAFPSRMRSYGSILKYNQCSSHEDEGSIPTVISVHWYYCGHWNYCPQHLYERGITVFFFICIWENWGTERLRNLPYITRNWIHGVCSRISALNHQAMHPRSQTSSPAHAFIIDALWCKQLSNTGMSMLNKHILKTHPLCWCLKPYFKSWIHQ